HVNPTVSVARVLQARGHEVAWAAHPGTVKKLLPEGARIFAMPEVANPGHVESVVDRAKAVRGAAALKLLWEDFLIPLARSMLPALEVSVTEFSPSVMICDQQAVAGGLVARRRDLPWATFATTSAGVVDPLAGLPQVKAWFDALIASLEIESGLPHHGEMSPRLVVAFTTDAIVGPIDRFPSHYRFVGPSISDRPEATPFPWDRLANTPRVLISMGTVNAEASGRFYATAVEALRDEPVQMIIAAPDLQAPSPAIVQSYLPQLALLPKLDAVICHGGHNTTCEALAHGLPLVIAPIKDDQPIVADQVVAAGAGIRVKFGRVQAPELRAAVRRILDEPSFREAARRVQVSFAAAGGAAAAATHVEALA
ncbi:MAG TPA: nucleotide disphospho-sugar-binding domain-containing protein, partial [Kofleriaceae bacterium]|nr:nucleotide disphospho-sugar-binding domain-containing protein [Kofleriaceae bacterium]